jgi:hypothetical protein
MKNNNLIIAGVAAAGTYFLFPQVKEFITGGQFSGAADGTTGFMENGAAQTTKGTIVDGALTKKQLNFLSSNLDTSFGESSIKTYDFGGGSSASILSTDARNERALTSNIDLFAGSNTLITYKKSGKVTGGSDFKNLQSVTASRASNSSNSKENVASFASGNIPTTKKSSTISSKAPVYSGPVRPETDYSNFKSGGSSTKKETKNDFFGRFF